jgi:hypothetical protein
VQYTPYDDSKIIATPGYARTVYLERKKEIDKAVQRGLAQIAKEDTYSITRLIRTIRTETLAVRLSERLPVQLWRNMHTEEIEGVLYLVQNDSEHQAQKIPLSEWWVRQLT